MRDEIGCWCRWAVRVGELSARRTRSIRQMRRRSCVEAQPAAASPARWAARAGPLRRRGLSRNPRDKSRLQGAVEARRGAVRHPAANGYRRRGRAWECRLAPRGSLTMPITAAATDVGTPYTRSVSAGCGKLSRKPDPLSCDRCAGAGPVASLPCTGPLRRMRHPRAVPGAILGSSATSRAQSHAAARCVPVLAAY